MDERKSFIKTMRSWQNGSITRREFLGRTGLGLAAAVVASNMPGLLTSQAFAGEKGKIGDRVVLATWPNYHNPENFTAFAEATGAQVQVNVFGSNEEMLAKLQAGGSGWDVFVPTNYTISTYVELGLIEPLDLAKLPNFDPASFEKRFMEQGVVNGKVYAVPKDWGTTGFVYDSKKLSGKPSSWKEFWELSQGAASSRVMVHDYQLTVIGNALKSFGYSFNSLDPKELADAEKLLLEVKPHLFAINSDYQPSMRNGDAWMAMCWTGDALQLRRDIPSMQYVLGREGGELWSDFFAIPKSAERREAAYAFINFLLDPQVNKREVEAHGYPSGDKRVDALLPKAMLDDPIMYPAAEQLSTLEFGAAATLTSPARAELMARFKAA
ncbi:spermidine/putrescine ABC transporter substrate-binding protein [Pseudomonas cavernicola]|uniref:Spermidine/putrescine ABC transporter substrate-binding protein n=1 Tax=Pseudomonas cavernicola TaxID=2320866 RepID=A0A418XHY2_9PSED|nr:spermidine/putrescine ABC transporter substrate-binding protein [Pseudomonas cavernicola]RJG12072.1 spermidine/putrescine ABC transporter substrate-binding protein [Pseudomonas cavernicola]